MNRLRTLLVSAALLASALAFSCGGGDSGKDGWKYLGDLPQQSGKTVSVYIDTGSIEVNDNIRTFRIQYLERDPDDQSDPGYVRQLGYWEVDCFDRKLFRIKEEFYTPSSKLIAVEDERVEEEYAGDESLGAKMSFAACRYAGR